LSSELLSSHNLREALIISQEDSAYITLDAEPHIIKELSEHFTFYVPGYKFMPAYRNRIWDGKIRLLDTRKRRIYAGLLGYIVKFCEEREYNVVIDHTTIKGDVEFSLKESQDFIDTLKLPFSVQEWQARAFVHAVRKKRCLLLSPTASGKSLIIYLLMRFYEDKKKLIVVPTTSLVAQMYHDFGHYGKLEGWKSENHVHQIMAGREKETDKNIVVSTWQSLFRMPKDYFDQYDVIVGDECHQFKSKSLIKIMTNLSNAEYRIGTTGTLDDTQTHQLVLEGLFGIVKAVTTTKNLIDNKFLSAFEIKAITLSYPEEIRKEISKGKYQDEVDFLVSNEKRNNFIRNLTTSLKGNTLVLFQYVEKHGKPLFNMIQKQIDPSRKIFFIYGGTDVIQRERVRAIVESEKDAIIVASNGVYSTGVNIKNLHNIIFTHPGKSKIRTLQSIGRGLRKSENKISAVLYDIVDDLSYKSKTNFSIRHFAERFKYYKAEKFSVKIYKVELLYK
jgi:superfamily II DNA or RNA helicase